MLLRTVRAADVDPRLIAVARHAHHPRTATDLAVLDVAAADVEFDVDLHLLAAVRARHELRVIQFHVGSLTRFFNFDLRLRSR